eukprot:CAMPEP_0182425274 /NCGR_PEP_ID=MMETSP1167-20130531/11645_1 /TAXON_ID=2988 /ORGANISM="Mallomonas Sp, Strain CCMP3275" /LENGTH=144 /DNA_ID=CAMNT_0024605801 /DNA_START=298 /DNA_END=728 /DNA_ORIENTATION=+
MCVGASDESPPHTDAVEDRRKAFKCFWESLRAQGWTKIRVTRKQAEIVRRAYSAVHQFICSISTQKKKKFFYRFDGFRYVGYANDRGREWLQLRSGCQEMTWPEDPAVDQRLYSMYKSDYKEREKEKEDKEKVTEERERERGER